MAASPFNVFDWYWSVQDSSPSTQVFSSKDEAFVPITKPSYVAWLATPPGIETPNAPSIISTAAELWGVFNGVALSIFRPSSLISTQTTDLTLTNPMPTYVSWTAAAASPGDDLILPNVRTPRGPPIGTDIVIDFTRTPSTTVYTDNFMNVKDAGGNILATVESATTLKLRLRSNATTNGTWSVVESSQPAVNSSVRGLLGSVNSTGTSCSFTYLEAVVKKFPTQVGYAATVDRNVSFARIPITVDFTTQGVNGVEGSNSLLQGFGGSGGMAGQWYDIWLIRGPGVPTAGLAVQQRAVIQFSGPILPTGYTHAAYLWTTPACTGTNAQPVTDNVCPPHSVVNGFVQISDPATNGVLLTNGTATSSTLFSNAITPADCAVLLQVIADNNTAAADCTHKVGEGTPLLPYIDVKTGTASKFDVVETWGGYRTSYRYQNTVANARTSVRVKGFTVPNGG